MKFTERVLLLIINELGLEIRSVKANCSHRAGRPTSEGPAGHIGSRGEFHEGRRGAEGIDFSTPFGCSKWQGVLRSK